MELIQNKEGLVATLTVKIPQEDYMVKVEKELKKMRQTAQIKGFRQGNAPMALIKKMYEQSILLDEINKILFEAIKNYEKENGEYLIGQVIPSENNQPFADINTTKDFEFVYEAGFLPEFTYQIENLELPYYNILLEGTEVDTKIEYLRKQYSLTENIEQIEDECYVYVETTYIKGDVETIFKPAFMSSQISDECKPLFLGAKVGDEINVEIHKAFSKDDVVDILTISEDEFELLPEILPFTITEITKAVPTELDQKCFDNVAGQDQVHNEEELKEYLKNEITVTYENLSLDKLYVDSIEILNEKLNIVLPEDFIVKYIRCVQKENEEPAEEKLEDLVKYFVQETKWTYILNSILQKSEFNITNAMVTEEAKRYLERRLGEQCFDIDYMVSYYLSDERAFNFIVNRLKFRQFARILKERAKLNVIDVSLAEFGRILNKTNENNTLKHSPETEEIEKDEIVVEESATESSETVNQENNTETQV
jgi:trigger factor